MGLPVLRLSSSFMHAVAKYPGGIVGCFLAHFTNNDSLPRKIAGSASTSTFSGPAQRSLMLRPACSPNPLRTLYTGGFSRFVTSTTAPVATGRSESCRAGFAPAGKQRLCTAHDLIKLKNIILEKAKAVFGDIYRRITAAKASFAPATAKQQDNPAPAAIEEPALIELKPETYEKAKRAAPGLDVYQIEKK